jgi:uncharacterized phage protein gp47/JayE
VPFSRPTLTTLFGQSAGDISAAQPGADPLLRFSNLGVLGKILAAGLNGLYGYLDWIARMAVPFTSRGEYLAGWGALKGLTYKPATKAALGVTFTGPGGVTIGSGLAVNRSDTAAFVTTASATFAGTGMTTVSVPVQSVLPGAAGNTTPGTQMTLGAPIGGVTSTTIPSQQVSKSAMPPIEATAMIA